MKFEHEYDAKGNHRLNIHHSNGAISNGEWESYQGIAKNDNFFVTTGYYEGSFDESKVYSSKEINTVHILKTI